MKRVAVAVVATIILMMGADARLIGQVTTGSISGVVTDVTGGVLPGVSVTAKDRDTGVARTIISDHDGRYRALNLRPGAYEIEAQLLGFQTEVRGGVTLTIGRDARVDFALKVGGLSEKVVVTGEAPLVDLTSSSVAGLVDEQKIRDLPLNGRSFEQLASLQPGVIVSRASSIRPENRKTQKVSIAGARPDQIQFLLDGSDVNDGGNTPGSAAGAFLGMDTVREFSVETSTYSAQFGDTSGGVVNIITKSGTNALRGSGYMFHRNAAFDSKNFFDPGPPPPFTRNQFGGTVGGSIVRDRVFFFGGYEGLRERLTTTEIRTVLDEDARRGFLRDPRTGNLEFVGVAPGVAPYLDLYPMPNGRNFGDGTAEHVGQATQPTNEDMFVVKVDHVLSDRNSYFVRYRVSDSKGTFVNRGTNNITTFPQANDTRYQYLAIEEKRIFSSNLLNTFRFGFNRSRNDLVSAPQIDVPESLDFIPGHPFEEGARISMGGLATLGNATSKMPALSARNLFEFANDVLYTRGRHALKVGGLVKRFHEDASSPTDGAGSYTVVGPRDLLLGKAQRFSAPLPGKNDPSTNRRQVYFGVYVQDGVRARSNLTFNVGLRYEFGTDPSYDEPVSHFEVDGTEWLPGPGEVASKFNLAPRVGFAWDPWENGRTSLRGGVGIFYSARENGGAARLDNYVGTSVSNVPFPGAYPIFLERAVAGASVDAEGMILIQRVPMTVQYNLTAERQLLANTVLTVGYVGSRGSYLGGKKQLNQRIPVIVDNGRKFFPPAAPYMFTAVNNYIVDDYDGQSSYNALLLNLNKRLSQDFQVQGSYTLGKSIDDGSHSTNSQFDNQTPGIQDAYCRPCGRGLSAFDVRHNFSLNYTWNLPQPRGGVSGVFLGGWQTSGILLLASGNPFSVISTFNQSNDGDRTSASNSLTERPDVVAGASNNPVLGGPDRYYDPSAFVLQAAGFYGNLGRNTIIGPGYATFDASLVKKTSWGQGRSVQFRAEVFNLFDRANFGTAKREIFASRTGVPAGEAGRITATVSSARQMQFSVKVLF